MKLNIGTEKQTEGDVHKHRHRRSDLHLCYKERENRRGGMHEVEHRHRQTDRGRRA